MTNNKIILCVLDGWGHSTEQKFNAINAAQPKFFNSLCAEHPFSLLDASGLSVGLPENQMGNSEIGHTTIGAGTSLICDLLRINDGLKDNSVLLQITNFVQRHKGNIHLIGLLSDGGVHSHVNHIENVYYGLVDKFGDRICVHAITDGRDTMEKCAKNHFKEGINYSTISGRYYAMDRDKRWDRISAAYDAILFAKGKRYENYLTCLDYNYSVDKTDEFIEPSIISDYTGVDSGDCIIFLNFRSDRMKQIVSEIMNYSKHCMPKISNLHCMSLVNYSENFAIPVIVNDVQIKDSLGAVIERNSMSQLRIAETEKYAHVTYFFSCKREKKFSKEKRVLIDSPKIATYDQKPEMSAYEMTDRLCATITNDDFNFILINYANADMVGHTGSFEATVDAVRAIDNCLEKFVPLALSKGYSICITADHGNAESMFDTSSQSIIKTHTLNPVPFIFVSEEPEFDNISLKKSGALYDIAPTILDFYGIEKPAIMTGQSLFIK
ncbi:2,3-bisphosphoglycerate-independent phosphoglycerate mutase [Anaplasmataceae bacterium AB001_6]|nr:2,3-bisphosphoglycerate-independent phosphoglycerate mutase [Anaplasmataceae bacterium AB001_6]